jgi:hypothetical protein
MKFMQFLYEPIKTKFYMNQSSLVSLWCNCNCNLSSFCSWMCDYNLFLQSPMGDSWNDICKNGWFEHKFKLHVGWYGQDSLECANGKCFVLEPKTQMVRNMNINLTSLKLICMLNVNIMHKLLNVWTINYNLDTNDN